jgi:hypothetical protein
VRSRQADVQDFLLGAEPRFHASRRFRETWGQLVRPAGDAPCQPQERIAEFLVSGHESYPRSAARAGVRAARLPAIGQLTRTSM